MSTEDTPQPKKGRGGIRLGAGRKRDADEKVRTSSVQLTPAQFKTVNALAAARGIPRAELIREIVAHFLKGLGLL